MKLQLEKFFVALFLMTYGIDAHNVGLFILPIVPYKFISMIFIVLFLINIKNNMKFFPKSKIVLFMIIFLYLFTFASYLYSFNFESEIPIDITKRYLMQTLSLTAKFAIGFYLYKFILKDIKFVKNYMFLGLYIVLFFAFLQMIGSFTHMFHWGTAGYANSFFATRVSSICGEPKGFAAYMAPYVLYFTYNKFKQHKLIGYSSLLTYIKAYSTSSYIVFFISYLVINVKEKRISLSKLLFVIVIILSTLSVDVIYDRSVGRIQSMLNAQAMLDPNKAVVYFPIINKDIVVDGNEASSFALLFDNPYIAITGIGYGMESIYARLYFNADTAGWINLDYAGNISPNNALLRNTLYFGLPFLLYILYIIMKTGVNALDRKYSDEVQFFGIFLIVCSISNILIYSNNILVIPLFFMALAVKKRIRQEKKDIRISI